MQRFVGTILVVLVCLAVFVSPVAAGDVLGPGDIAIIGYNFDNPDQLAFVCLKKITSGTEIIFTDNGWLSNQSFRTGEGYFTWSEGCELGQIISLLPDNLSPSGVFSLNYNGDQLFAYQQPSMQPVNHIFALNGAGLDWQSTATSDTTSSLPTVLASLNPSPEISILSLDNAIYIGPKSFNTTADALAAIVNEANWSGSDTVRQTMPSGSFSFTTTAVYLSDFSAESGRESAPWWVLVGLVVIPVLVLVFKRPKRDCCK
ncbi:MAG: hypothetical protein CVU41_18305 [Chloroflexi bacterium HGW-Chloroflexi-3]|nr:MAG: hypothetical protein CVU41_18305 [Chloroflexi bacterium HGW-Chloroflexi-3]